MKTYMICTKAKPYLLDLKNLEEPPYQLENMFIEGYTLNGKVCIECDIEEFDKYYLEDQARYYQVYLKDKTVKNKMTYTEEIKNNLLSKSCLSMKELWDYAKTTYKSPPFNQKVIYALHLKNIKPCDLRLSDFYKDYEVESIDKKGKTIYLQDTPYFKITRVPQSFMYAYYKGERVLLMSIKSKWICKILNGEKTVEIRKSIPKELKGERKR